MITLHMYAESPFNEKVIRTLNYKGIEEYRIVEHGLADKAVEKVSPSKKLPALEYFGDCIVDSTDIVYYLEKQFPEHPVIPENPADQAMVHVLEDWADESLYFYEMHLRFALPHNGKKNIPRMLVNNGGLMGWFLAKVLPGAILKITRTQGVGRKDIDQLTREVRRHFEAVQSLLGTGDWLVAGQFSLADMAVYAMFNCLRDAQESAAVLEEFPKVTEWMHRVEMVSNSTRKSSHAIS